MFAKPLAGPRGLWKRAVAKPSGAAANMDVPATVYALRRRLVFHPSVQRTYPPSPSRERDENRSDETAAVEPNIRSVATKRIAEGQRYACRTRDRLAVRLAQQVFLVSLPESEAVLRLRGTSGQVE